MRNCIFFTLLLLAGCSKPSCNYTVQEATREGRSDVINIIRTFETETVPEGFTDGDTEHFFFVIDSCD